jgi:hypothetical protein
MTYEGRDIAWDLFVEVRKEILEYQKIRAQIIGFKITFVSAGIGVIVANSDKVPITLLVVPAFAAMFFDLLLTSYSFSIKRAGYYCRKYVEPVMRKVYDWPPESLLWEEFMMTKPEAKQTFAMKGNLGLTILAVGPAVYVLLLTFPLIPWHNWLSILLLIILLAYDIKAYRHPKQFPESEGLKMKESTSA